MIKNATGTPGAMPAHLHLSCSALPQASGLRCAASPPCAMHAAAAQSLAHALRARADLREHETLACARASDREQ